MTKGIWDMWAENWKDAYNFFNSKGNPKTRSRLKSTWYKNFIKNHKQAKQEK